MWGGKTMAVGEKMTGRKSLRVLVADDDPIQRNLIAARLVGMQAEVSEAEEGLSAWSLLHADKFDLAIVDLGMPDLDGFGLIQCMRGHPRTRHLPIVVVTSRGDRAAMDAALHAGASSFLVKPIAWATFEHHLGFLLRLVRSADDAREAGQSALSAFQSLSEISTGLSQDVAAKAAVLSQEIKALKRACVANGANRDLNARTDRIAALAEGLEQCARQAGAGVPELPDVRGLAEPRADLRAVVADALQAAGITAAVGGVKLQADVPMQSVSVPGDSATFTAALRYLLQDAIIAADRGGEVNLCATIAGDGSLTIEIGGAADRVLFEPTGNWREPLDIGSKPLGRSVGPTIGLLIARTIAEAMGGSLQLTDSAELGRTARLVLPSCQIAALSSAA